MWFGQNVSPGWSSTLSRSWEIPPTMRPSTCSTVVRDCDWIRIERSEVLQTWLELNTNASGSGRLPAQLRNRATIGAMTIWCRSHDQLLPKGKNYDDLAQGFTVPIKNGFNLTAVIAGVQEQTEHVPSVLLVFRRNWCLTFSVHYTTLQPAPLNVVLLALFQERNSFSEATAHHVPSDSVYPGHSGKRLRASCFATRDYRYGSRR